jgi:hypothetical protein
MNIIADGHGGSPYKKVPQPILSDNYHLSPGAAKVYKPVNFFRYIDYEGNPHSPVLALILPALFYNNKLSRVLFIVPNQSCNRTLFLIHDREETLSSSPLFGSSTFSNTGAPTPMEQSAALLVQERPAPVRGRFLNFVEQRTRMDPSLR